MRQVLEGDLCETDARCPCRIEEESIDPSLGVLPPIVRKSRDGRRGAPSRRRILLGTAGIQGFVGERRNDRWANSEETQARSQEIAGHPILCPEITTHS